jgi:hypothetical protein
VEEKAGFQKGRKGLARRVSGRCTRRWRRLRYDKCPEHFGALNNYGVANNV